MNIPEIIQTLATGIGAVETLRKLIPKLPDQADKDEAERALRNAEISFQVAQAEVAKNLEYPICRRHWPPVIMLLRRHKDPYTDEYQCPECNDVWPGEDPPSFDD